LIHPRHVPRGSRFYRQIPLPILAPLPEFARNNEKIRGNTARGLFILAYFTTLFLPVPL
jgi:hypothetical protein